MIKLKRVCEEVSDSSHTSIMYNMADTLKKKGWDVSYSDGRGMTVNFDFTDYDPKKTQEWKAWLKDNNGKSLVFKGAGKKGFFQWNVEKGEDGKRYLTTKNVTVGNDKNLLSLQKKLPLPKDVKVDGKLTGKSAKPFSYPDNVPVTNMVSPTFQSFLKKYYNKIVADIALALSEVVEKEEKKESNLYFIEYDENCNRINEGYIVEADNKDAISWDNKDVQDKIVEVIKGIEIDKDKTTKDKLIFKYNDKNGSLHLQGYMLVLDLDTDDNIPPTNYPVKDKNNLSIDNLLDSVKTVFSRRESKITEKEKEEVKEEKEEVKEAHMWDDDVQSDERNSVRPDPTYYVLSGDVVGEKPQWNEIVGDEEGYLRKEEAIAKAKELMASKPEDKSVYAVTDLVDINYFIYDNFWDSLDKDEIKIIWMSDNTVESRKCESFEDHVDFHDNVFHDIATGRLVDKLGVSLIPAKSPSLDNVSMESRMPNTQVFWFYLSPSYAMQQLSDIVVPVCLKDHILSMPIADMPKPDAVFNGDYTENSLYDYDDAVQDFLINDAPMSDIMEVNLDNSDEVKSRVVDVINNMAEDYQNNRSMLSSELDLVGESVLHEARYYIIPSDSSVTSMNELKKITPMGFTDLSIAKENMIELAESGKFDHDLSILDTHYSNNKDKWEVI